MTFTHENLDVYQAALDFALLAEQTRESVPRGKAHLSDQLLRASTSIVLNIAEGAGKFDHREKRRFYAIASGSATECAAVYDLLVRFKLIDEKAALVAKRLLARIVGMLIKLAAAMERRRFGGAVGAGAGEGEKADRNRNR